MYFCKSFLFSFTLPLFLAFLFPPYVTLVKAPQICDFLSECKLIKARRDSPALNNIWGKQSLITTLLPLHNALRRQYDVVLLAPSTPLTNQTISYTRGCAIQNILPEVAVNYASGYPNPRMAFESRSAGEALYRSREGLMAETMHFTQIIWKNIEEIGCAVYPRNGKFGKVKSWLLMCVYPPGANVVGETTWNVGSPGGSGNLSVDTYNTRGLLRDVMASRGEKRKSVGKVLMVVVGGAWMAICVASKFVFVMNGSIRRYGR